MDKLYKVTPVNNHDKENYYVRLSSNSQGFLNWLEENFYISSYLKFEEIDEVKIEEF